MSGKSLTVHFFKIKIQYGDHSQTSFQVTLGSDIMGEPMESGNLEGQTEQLEALVFTETKYYYPGQTEKQEGNT